MDHQPVVASDARAWAKATANAIWRRRWKIACVAAGYALARACEFVADGWPRQICELIAKLMKVGQ